jgi:hypothetical protein
MSDSQRSLLVLLLLGIGYLIYCLPLLPEAADDIAMVEVFSLDESAAAKNVRSMLENVVNHFEPDMIVLRNARFKRFQDLNRRNFCMFGGQGRGR